MLTQFGMDYGLRPPMMLIADTVFVENFQKAKCQGLVYMSTAEADKNIPFEFGFMMQKEEYAELFLDSLISWKEKSEGKSTAIDFEFLEKLNGEYMLSIAPNMRMFIDRMVPDHLADFVIPLAMQAYQAKDGMRIGENYLNFRDNYLEGRKIAVRYYLVDNSFAITKKSERYLVKTEFKFSKEGELQGDSEFNPLLNKQIKKSKPPKVEFDDPKFLEDRTNNLKYFFPITIQKLTQQEWLTDYIKSINNRYSSDQIRQAVANLILFERLRLSKSTDIETIKPGYGFSIIRYLAENHESFDSFFPDEEFFSKQIIEKQIRLDEKYFKLIANK